MSEQDKIPFVRRPATWLVVTLLLSAATSSVFGYVAGYVAAGHAGDSFAMSLMPETVRRFARSGPAKSVAGADDSKVYTLPQMREAIRSQKSGSVVDVVKKAGPAVVSIVVSKDVPVWEQVGTAPMNDFFSQFFGYQMQQPQYQQKGTEKQDVGAGTGFLVSADGYIVTNRHVIVDEKAEYTAIMEDKTKHVAKLIGRDAVNDIAVLKIEGKDLPHLTMGDSDAVEVGEEVVAIGYALGRFGNTVSTGVVSGLQRSITAGDGYNAENLFDVIQTDAAINPGNSGGPLLNMKGEVIGVNVAIVQNAQSIGFSLPINDVKKIVGGVQSTGKISRPFLGVRYQLINEEIKKANQLTVDYGAIVVRGQNVTDLAVMPGSPADRAGIVENDIILEVNGVKITEDRPLAVVLAKSGVGDVVKMKVLHKGETKDIEVTLTERAQE